MPTTLTQLPPTTWESRAACRTNPDLWTSTHTHERALAIHTCRTHCPVLTQCAAGVQARPCPGSVQAGILFNTNVQPAPTLRQPTPTGRRCEQCAEDTAPAAKKPASRWVDCGTIRAYRRHGKRRETACGRCRDAERVASKQRRAAKKAAALTPEENGRRGGLGNRPPDTIYRQRVATVTRLARQRCTDNQIAAQLGLTQRQVRYLRRMNNIPAGNPTRTPPPPPHLTAEMAQRRDDRLKVIAAMAAAGATDPEIGVAVGWLPQNVWRARRAHSIPAGVRRGRPTSNQEVAA
jgi:hypothetical protein